MNKHAPFRRVYFTRASIAAGGVPDRLADGISDQASDLNPDAEHDLLVCCASELLSADVDSLPRLVGPDTRYLVVLDVPERAILRIPTILGVHKPDQRIHATRDALSVLRLVIALHRDRAWEGVVDAYVLGQCLVVVLGDMSIRQFPKASLPRVANLEVNDFLGFTIDASGSFLHWPTLDVHLGPSQMLQAVDPMYLADVEIERYAREKVSLALLDMRQDRRLRQSDIRGLSERHVRRLEKEKDLRLSVDAAEKFAAAFDQTLSEFLDELSHRIGLLADPGEDEVTSVESSAHVI